MYVYIKHLGKCFFLLTLFTERTLPQSESDYHPEGNFFFILAICTVEKKELQNTTKADKKNSPWRTSQTMTVDTSKYKSHVITKLSTQVTIQQAPGRNQEMLKTIKNIKLIKIV